MYSGPKLLYLWENSEEIYGEQLSQRQLARKLGMNFNILHGRIYRAQKAEEAILTNEVEFKDDGNTRAYTSKGPRIKTLEQLIVECEIDLNEWIIERHIINKWEVGAKINEGHLVVEPLFQVKAWLKKRHPEQLEPAITRVEIGLGEFKFPEPRKSASGKAMFLADPHFGFSKDVLTGELEPFHDRKALAATLFAVSEIKPDIVTLAGDWLDLAEWSDKFIRSPDMYNTSQPSAIELVWYLGQLRSLLPDAEIYYMEGNHEKRLVTAINKQIPYAYGLKTTDGLPLLSVQNWLGLDRLGIEYIGNYPDEEIWLTDNLRVIHGDKVRSKSGGTAGAIIEDATATTLFGHVHRMELASKTMFGRYGANIVSAFSPGCLCRIDGVVPAVNGKMNWQQGIGLVHYNEKTASITPIPIIDGGAILGGSTLIGNDYLPQLRKDTGISF